VGPKAVRGLDKVSGFGLKRAVRKILTKKQAALVQQGLESARAEISNRLERGWEQVQRLEKRIEAAASMGLPHEELIAQRDTLCCRATKLAERGEEIERELSELIVVDHGIRGARWRPTRAEPF
jgi:ferritin-like metal-binding protein YciE